MIQIRFQTGNCCHAAVDRSESNLIRKVRIVHLASCIIWCVAKTWKSQSTHTEIKNQEFDVFYGNKKTKQSYFSERHNYKAGDDVTRITIYTVDLSSVDYSLD